MTAAKKTAVQRAGYRGYINTGYSVSGRAPQHIQNVVIRDYARNRGLHYLLSNVEYEWPGCTMMMEEVLVELPKLEGAIFYSIFLLPEDRKKRKNVYDRVIAAGAALHFAVEDFVIETADDAARIEDILLVQQALTHCPTGKVF